jgi:release factor glutamine methyltransferase
VVADVGTGSGCLAVTLAAERPDVTVVAVDRSLGALRVARGNASRHEVALRVHFAQMDLLRGVNGRFDLIVSNPPYVPDNDVSGLAPEVRDHEPAAALMAGPDGLTLIRRLVVEASDRLPPSGALIFEFGAGQAENVADLISLADGLRMIELRRDLQGIPRVAIAEKRGS